MSNYSKLNECIAKLQTAVDEFVRECDALAADGVAEAAEFADETRHWSGEFLLPVSEAPVFSATREDLGW